MSGKESKFRIDGLALRDPTTVSFKKKHITTQDRTMSGKPVVDYIATKSTVSVGWGVLSDAEFSALKAHIEKKRDNNEFYTLTFVMPKDKPDDDAAADEASRQPTEEVTTIRAYTEELSYYPYFTSNGKVVWRDVAIEFAEV